MINISLMEYDDIPGAINLWEKQFNKYCYCSAFPNFINGGQILIESYIKEQINKCNAIVAKIDNNTVGFMAWMYFDFHNERTAFLPIVGHAASLRDELGIYQEMYDYASNRWVYDNRFNHLWMTYFDDENLKNSLYDLGFGSYVIDACQSTSEIRNFIKSEYKITYASKNDVDALYKFTKTINEYYANSPIFLIRNEHTKDELIDLICKDYVLIAWDNGNVIGVMSLTINQDFHFEHLTTPDSAYIKSIGAYIHPEYRRKGIGTSLLEEVFTLCSEQGKPFIHVSFESSNPNAIRFWPKHFKPVIRSVRRTINKDANNFMGKR